MLPSFTHSPACRLDQYGSVIVAESVTASGDFAQTNNFAVSPATLAKRRELEPHFPGSGITIAGANPGAWQSVVRLPPAF